MGMYFLLNLEFMDIDMEKMEKELGNINYSMYIFKFNLFIIVYLCLYLYMYFSLYNVI